MEFWTAEPSTRECTPPAALAQARALSVHAMLHSALQRTHRATATPAHPPSFPVHRPSAHTFALSLTLPQNTPAGGREGRRGGERRGECARTCRHAHTLAHTHTLPRTPGTPRRSQPPQASQGGARRHAAVADDGCPPLRPSPSRLALLSLLLPDASSTRAAPGGSSALASSRTQPLLPLPLLRLLHPLAPRYNRQTPQQRPFLEPL